MQKEVLFTEWMDKARLLIEDKYGYDYDKVVRVIELVKPDFVFIDYLKGRKGMTIDKELEKSIAVFKKLIEHYDGKSDVDNIALAALRTIEWAKNWNKPMYAKFLEIRLHNSIQGYNRERGT